MARSPQTLSEDERRVLATWAADCAERVLPLFEAERPDDPRPREAIQRTRAFASGALDTASAIRLRFGGGSISKAELSEAAYAAARAAGQASAVCHMGAHALGAAAYAIEAVEPELEQAEIDWQIHRLTTEARTALKLLPPVLSDRAGPLGPGLLTRGRRGKIIARLQEALG
jgi:hypothetical protein